jgi:hypothetical protein
MGIQLNTQIFWQNIDIQIFCIVDIVTMNFHLGYQGLSSATGFD